MNNSKYSQKLLTTTMAFLVMTIGFQAAFAAPGEGPEDSTSDGIVSTADLLPIDGMAPTFFGNGGWSADGCGTNSQNGCSLQAEVPAGSTVEGAWLYAATQQTCPATTSLTFDGTPYVLPELVHNTFDAFSLCSYRTEVTAQVAATVGGGGGITLFPVLETAPSTLAIDGTALVVVFSNPGEDQLSVIVLDGGLDSDGQTTSVGLAAPLDKTVPGFDAVMSLGISFGNQGTGPFSHLCGGNQNSQIDINGVRMTSCAGHHDDGDQESNGALITVGGVGDSTNIPVDPFATNTGEDDELYSIADFLSQGDTQIDITNVNPSDDDNIFLAIIAINAKASLEICDNGIDDDLDGLIDLDDPDCKIIGGEFLPIDTTALLLAGAQTNAVWILSVLAVIGSVAFGALYLTTRRD